MINLILLLVLILCLAILYTYGKRNPFDAIAFYVYLFGLQYIFRPAILLFELDETIPDQLFFSYPYHYDIQTALTMMVVWSFTFTLVFLLLKPRKQAQLETHNFDISTAYNHKAIICFTGILGFLGILLIFYLLAINNFNFAAASYNIRFNYLLSSFPLIRRFPQLAAYLLITIVAVNHISSKKFLSKPQNRFFILAAFVLAFSTTLYGSRGPFILWLAYTMITMHLFIKRIPKILWIILLPALFALLTFMKIIRYMLWAGTADTGVKSNVFAQISDTANLDKFDNFILLIQNMSHLPYSYGVDFINGFLALVPRVLWPSKPIDLTVDIKFHDLFYPHDGVGWPIGSPAEFYWNFGDIGLIVGAILSAITFVAITRYFSNAMKDPYQYLLMYTFIMTVLQIGYTALVPVHIINSFLILFIAITFAKRIARTSNRLSSS